MDETFDAASVMTQGSNVVKIDFSEVESINSVACYRWIEALKNHPGKTFLYQRVSVAVMNAIAMIPNLLPANQGLSAVESFFLPFECWSCDHHCKVLHGLTDIEFENDKALVPLQPCPECGNPMSLSRETAEFLYFITDILAH